MADQSVNSLGTKAQLLALEQRTSSGFTHVWTINYTDINGTGAQGDTVTVNLGDTPTRFLVDKVACVVETAFATTGTLTLQVGTDGDPDNFLDAQDAKTAGIILADTSAGVKTEAGSAGIASDVLVARFTTQAATGAPTDITAGKVHILLGIVDLDKLI